MEKTKEFLKKASALVAGDRENDYGDKVHNHKNIARLWSAYLDTEIRAHDVAILMTLLKVARTKLGAVSEDTYIDMSAYSAIAGEIKFREPKKESEGERRGRETWEYVKNYNKKLKEKKSGK
jgi:hypothetical protein|tara:strand:+ start:590 stop:955 length:366 start_codon:yes stop_codon:yes gene_type:complete